MVAMARPPIYVYTIDNTGRNTRWNAALGMFIRTLYTHTRTSTQVRSNIGVRQLGNNCSEHTLHIFEKISP